MMSNTPRAGSRWLDGQPKTRGFPYSAEGSVGFVGVVPRNPTSIRLTGSSWNRDESSGTAMEGSGFRSRGCLLEYSANISNEPGPSVAQEQAFPGKDQRS
jgi:hypothetical protein